MTGKDIDISLRLGTYYNTLSVTIGGITVQFDASALTDARTVATLQSVLRNLDDDIQKAQIRAFATQLLQGITDG